MTGPTVTMAATFLRRIALPNLFRLGFETLPEEGAPATHARWIAGHILAHGLDSITATRSAGPIASCVASRATAYAMAILVDSGWAVAAPDGTTASLGDQPGCACQICGRGRGRADPTQGNQDAHAPKG